LNGHFDIALEETLGVHAPGTEEFQKEHIGVGVLGAALGLVSEEKHVEGRGGELVADFDVADGQSDSVEER